MKIRLHRWLGVAVAWLGITSASAYDFQVDGIYYDINTDETTVTVTNETGFSASYSGEVIIPQSVTFQGNTYIVTSIGYSAFLYCTGLTSITIPNSVTTIGENAFFCCAGLTEVTIPESVTSIGSWAFSSCTSLTEVIIPNSVTSIGERAFSNCTGLTSITIPNSVTTIGENAFFCCAGLTEVTIPESVTSIGSWAFSSCTSLTEVIIPNSVTTIGRQAFHGCTSLTEVTIGESVTSIGDLAFLSCTSLETIKSYATIPPTIEINTFTSYDATLYVPVDCGDAYREAEYWANFTNIVESIDSRVEALQDENARVYMVGNTLHVENGGKVYQIYTLAGQLVYTGNDTTVPLTNTGIYIVHMGDFIQKVIVR